MADRADGARLPEDGRAERNGARREAVIHVWRETNEAPQTVAGARQLRGHCDARADKRLQEEKARFLADETRGGAVPLEGRRENAQREAEGRAARVGEQGKDRGQGGRELRE
jgi:hypothetical protein